MGAPRKHPPANAAEDIERLAAQGFGAVGIAKHFNVSRHTFKRWCEEDESIEEAFEVGKETERQALHSLIVQCAAQNKPANANAMFLLKARHGYREMDSPSTKVDVNLNAPTNVMVVHSHGSDDQWAARAAAQQNALVADAGSPPQVSFGPPVWNASLVASTQPKLA